MTVRRIGDRDAVFGSRTMNTSVNSKERSWYIPKGGIPDTTDVMQERPPSNTDHWLVGALGVGTSYQGLRRGRDWDDDGVWG